MESVLVVVVDAAPSSRVKAMIHSIMGISSCWALLFPPHVWGSLEKFFRAARSASPFGRQLCARGSFDLRFLGWLAESEYGARYQLDNRRRRKRMVLCTNRAIESDTMTRKRGICP